MSGSTPLLFVTASVEPQVIEKFITESSRPTNSVPKNWLLVRSPSEGILGPPLDRARQLHPDEYSAWPDAPPIQAFDSGFHDATVDVLGRFALEHDGDEADNTLPPERQFTVCGRVFAVLDARSAIDETVAMYHYHERMPEEFLLENDGDWDDEIVVKEWVEWRVKFLVASVWARIYQIGFEYGDFVIDRDQYIDANGVLQMPGIEHNRSMLPDLNDDEKAAWGPDKTDEEKQAEWRFTESPLVDLINAGSIITYPADEHVNEV